MNKTLFLFFLLCFSFHYSQKSADEKAQVSKLLKSATKAKYSNWDNAVSDLNKAELLAEKSSDNELIANFKAEAATIFYDRDLLDISLKYTLDAYHYFKTTDKAKALESESLLAIIYARMNNPKEALKYFRSYYDAIKSIDKNRSIKALNNIGNLYLNYGNRDSAYYYFNSALTQINSTTDANLIVMLNANLGKTLADKNPKQAENYFLYAIKSAEKLDDNPLKSVLYTNFSEFYLNKKSPELAVKYAEEAKKYSSVKFSFQNQRILKSLYQSYLAAGKPEEAAQYFQIYDQIRDSLNIEEKAVNIEREKIQYAFKVKESETELANNKKSLKLVYAILLLLFVLATLVLFLLRYRSNLEKEKLGKQLALSRENELKLALELRNKELVTKSILENERASIYQELKQNLESIKTIDDREELRKEVDAVIFKLVKNPSKVYWEEFELRFTNVYDSFYEKLLEKHPNLSHNDKKICALIKLNLNSKDIASMTQTSVKSVENSRTRLRKKLNLTHSNIELHSYLSNL